MDVRQCLTYNDVFKEIWRKTRRAQLGFSKENALVLGAKRRSILCAAARQRRGIRAFEQQRNKAFYDENTPAKKRGRYLSEIQS